MTHQAMNGFTTNEWGQSLGNAACKWAAILAPDTGAAGTMPYTMLLIFDTKRKLQGWFALWPLASDSAPLRIVKIRSSKQAQLATLDNMQPMVQLEQHVRAIGSTRRYWLVWNRKLRIYEDFKQA